MLSSGVALPDGTPCALVNRMASGGSGDTGNVRAMDPSSMNFLLIGQSNMEGVPKPESEDLAVDPRIRVLAYDDCPTLGRTYNRWVAASPPLHGCNAGVGPGDAFAKVVAAAHPNAVIGLVPCAISGVDIDFFRKGVVSARRGEFRIPPDNHWSGAYDWVVSRARIAQESGVIRGILFHQGESDSGSATWVAKVAEMVADLRADLDLSDAPFVAGELLHGGACAAHNALVHELPGRIDHAFVVSASGLAGLDRFHFDLPGQRELGRRYGRTMLGALQRMDNES